MSASSTVRFCWVARSSEEIDVFVGDGPKRMYGSAFFNNPRKIQRYRIRKCRLKRINKTFGKSYYFVRFNQTQTINIWKRRDRTSWTYRGGWSHDTRHSKSCRCTLTFSSFSISSRLGRNVVKTFDRREHRFQVCSEN